MSEYTPRVGTMRIAYIALATESGISYDEAGAEFERGLAEIRRAAYWEGVNDQWKHRPFGNRLPETSSPYYFDIRLGVDSHGS